MQIFSYILISVCTTLPMMVFAAAAPTDFKGLVAIIVGIIEKLVIVIFALAFLAFLWGVIKTWIIHGGDAESVESGKKIVVTSIIVFTVMTSIWGILYILQSSIFGS